MKRKFLSLSMKFVIECMVGCILLGGLMTLADYLSDATIDNARIVSNLFFGLLFTATMALIDPFIKRWVAKVNSRKANK